MDEYGLKNFVRVTIGTSMQNRKFIKEVTKSNMILTLKPKATKKDVDAICRKIKGLGFTPHLSKGKEVTVIGVIGQNAILKKTFSERWILLILSRRFQNRINW